jgi:hypothetical protein
MPPRCHRGRQPSWSQALVATQPVTVAGVAAALAYWSEIASEGPKSEDCYDTDIHSTVVFLAKIAKTVKTLA